LSVQWRKITSVGSHKASPEASDQNPEKRPTTRKARRGSVNNKAKEEAVTVSKVKRLLVGVLAVGALTALIEAGTFATFDATTSNSSTFQSGTIVLSNTVNAGTACLSTTAGNPILAANSGSCDALFASTNQKPGDTATGDLTLVNTGSINATTLKLYAAGACANASAPDANGNFGNGLMCTQLQMTVLETLSDFSTSTGSGCVYGAAACAFGAAFTPGDFGTNHQVGGAFNLGALNAGATRYFVVKVFFPAVSNNSFQGSKDTLVLDWNAAQ
jgi:hypothetical protein